ncbi:VanZ family protein [Rubrivirga marina]|uniref:VanZ family protein n=1 Tax=Rubrivirga marina TaxID=1196024 RepID=UPI000BA97A9C|nr:VanZ family protein [Rubrivirga marina]
MTSSRIAIIWTIAVLAACSIPAAELTPPEYLPFAFDKWVHAGMFLVFGVLWMQAAPHRAWAVFAAGVAFGVGIEIWQGLLPIDRMPDALDAAADVVGLMVGIPLGAWIARRGESNG